MDRRKLDRWAELLLDTGKRNQLISFKDRKSSTVEVLLPDSEQLFERIEGATTFEFFDPKSEEDDLDDEVLNTEETPKKKGLSKESFFEKYSPKIRKQSQLLAYSTGAKPYVALKNIQKRAKEFIEEAGVNVAYMAFGFVHWKESENSQLEHRAPLLLVPIAISRESLIDPFYVTSTGDDIVVNPTFAYKLDAEYGLKIPELAEEDSLSSYLGKIEELVNGLGWAVSDECKIGCFSFLKINMYKDLKDHADMILDNSIVRALMGEGVPESDNDMSGESGNKLSNPLLQLHTVVDADSSQLDAIELAKSGESFVLQGPPGTGKSQTITNIIAECLFDNKKVLFVSEKLAALNVVYEKLKKAGLEDFCLELHSHKTNKKDVIAELCRTVRAKKSTVSSEARSEIEAKAAAQKQLDEYATALHTTRGVINKSLYQLFELYAKYREAPDIRWNIPEIDKRDEQYLTEVLVLLSQYVEYVPTIGFNYRMNTWYGYKNQDTSYQAEVRLQESLQSVSDMVHELVPVLEAISSEYQINCNSIEDVSNCSDFFLFASKSKTLTPALLKEETFETSSANVKEMADLSGQILAEEAKIFGEYEQKILDVDCTDIHDKLTKLYSGMFSRLFNQEYKQIMSTFRLCRKDGRKLSYEEAVALSADLSQTQSKIAKYNALAEKTMASLGAAYTGLNSDWSMIQNDLEQLRVHHLRKMDYGCLAEMTTSIFADEQSKFGSYHEKIESLIKERREQIAYLAASYKKDVFDVERNNLHRVEEKCKECLSDIGRLDNWCRFRELMEKIDSIGARTYIEYVIENDIAAEAIVNAYVKRFYYQWINVIIHESAVLSSFSRISQDSAVGRFSEKDRLQFEISKASIKSQVSRNRPSISNMAAGSAVSVLLREGDKKRRQMSVRNLMYRIGDLIQVLKPCFLMSPLSVSTFLDPHETHFDVVIFDEASQIFPQDAIGAIYRADQVIVVGDSKQMPPSNFFTSSLESEEVDEEVGDVTDFESILDLCSTSMRQLRLSWHYRSRFEQLISFSNKNFYNNNLVTFPSSTKDRPWIGVDYYHVDGRFDRQSHTNRKEAEFVVDLVYKNIERYPERSLGVVAFSVAQQDMIDRLLSRYRQQHPEKEFFFKDNRKEPFFIKNLETVQGDERDTIIFSVAYGEDEQGRLYHNFGPLNRVGGERRLNVAVTRAKCNVQLVSSMHYTDIDLKRTSSEGARLLRDYLDYAENGTLALQRAVSVDPFDDFDSYFEMEVCEYLREQGFTVDTQVGCAGFRIDLGLRKEDSSDYYLAVECDGATYHSSKNARDRDRLRQEVLEQMGWKFYRIWSTDWFKNKEVEKERLLEAVKQAELKSKTAAIVTNSVEEPNEEEAEEKTTFEVKLYKQVSRFREYTASSRKDLAELLKEHRYVYMVKTILEEEAPLSEEWLMRRTAWYFGREKVTNVVRNAFEREMRGCERLGIIRKNGFMYLEGQTRIFFREAGKGEIRDVKDISPEELAAGLKAIIKDNVSGDKTGIYHTLAEKCGVKRVGKAINERFDEALGLLLKQNIVTIDGDTVSIN